MSTPTHITRRTRAAALVLYPAVAGTLCATLLQDWQPTMLQALVLLAATFTGGRVVAVEKVGQPIRDLLADTPLQEVSSCPRCSGVWIALALVTLAATTPAVWPMLWAMAIAGVNITWQDAHMAMVQRAWPD